MKRNVWNKIKLIGFDMDYENEFIKIIEENFDRVKFSEDLVGLRDVCFAPLVPTRDLDYAFFVAFNVDTDKSTYAEKEKVMVKSIENSELKALTGLKRFFEHTKRDLYLGIGFEETVLYDKNKVIQLIKEYSRLGIEKTTSEITKEIREFPDWYLEVSEKPEKAKFLPKNLETELKILIEDYNMQDEFSKIINNAKNTYEHLKELI